MIADVCLNVQEIEPPTVNNSSYELSNVVMTPHMGWKDLETRNNNFVIILADNI
ncbi:MAG: hypothetical protein J6K70_02050 [Selenomonadales bacterium]|nr:hypothetical protein [Selenomonadales bacterium]